MVINAVFIYVHIQRVDVVDLPQSANLIFKILSQMSRNNIRHSHSSLYFIIVELGEYDNQGLRIIYVYNIR